MTAPRRSPRKVASRILSIDIEPNNQAIILNYSDDGLGFRALGPVTQLGTIHFSFLDRDERVQAAGELIWTDPSQKIGGLRFAEMPSANLERLRAWAEQPGAFASAPASLPVEAVPVAEPEYTSPAPRRSQPNPPRAYTPPAEPQWGQPPPPSFALMGDDPDYARYAAEMSATTARGKFLGGFVTGAVFAAFVALVLFSVYGSTIGGLITQGRAAIGMAPPAQGASPMAPGAPQSSPVPRPAAASAAPVQTVPAPAQTAAPQPSTASANPSASSAALAPGATTGTAADLPPTSPAASAPPISSSIDRQRSSDRVAQVPPPAPSAAPAADAGDEDLALARRYLNDRAGAAQRAAAVPLLWSAIQKGNTAAEITLADLYSRGDGVTQNCNQARVLLRAAAEKGNREASDKLAIIVRTGCR